MKVLLISLMCLVTKTVLPQEPSFPRDTSFTITGTLLKEQKNFPFIRIANPPAPTNILIANNVVYKTTANRALHADIYYPIEKNTGGYPGVVLIHGGGWRSGDRSQTVTIAQQLAAKGYVTVALEYRLSLEATYPASVFDIKTFIKWFRANNKMYQLDQNKIATMGFSSGGQLAALIGVTNGQSRFEDLNDQLTGSSAVQAIIDVDGILAFKHAESAEGAVAAAWLGGTYEEKPAVWEEASPLSHVGSKTPPTLFINSSLPRFHAGRDDMIRKMQALNIYSEVHTIPETPHPFWFFDPWFNQVMSFTSGFLDKVFKGK